MLFSEELSFPLLNFEKSLGSLQVPPIFGLTEVYGEAGSGKTQYCLTIVSNLIKDHPASYALYICTDHKFPANRWMQINAEYAWADRLGLLHVFEADHLLACLERPHLDIDPPIILIVDSITAPFRYGPGRDQSCLDACIFRLKELTSLGVLVICTNQVSSDRDHLVPCLGASWASAVDTRIAMKVSRGGPDGLDVLGRRLNLLKSPIAPPTSWKVSIEATGLTLD